MNSKLFDERAVAERLAVSVKTLRRWRWEGREVPFVKIEGAVRCEPEAIEACIAKRRQVAVAED